jgi:hypothetical protein
MSEPYEPKSGPEWQEAVDAADTVMRLEAARRYGMLKGGRAGADMDRIVDILKRGLDRGYVPHKQAVKRVLRQMDEQIRVGLPDEVRK